MRPLCNDVEATLNTAGNLRTQILKSGNSPETLSEQIFELLASVRLEVPKPSKNTAALRSRAFPELHTSLSWRFH